MMNRTARTFIFIVTVAMLRFIFRHPVMAIRGLAHGIALYQTGYLRRRVIE